MKLKSNLLAFGALLICSTLISFVGYNYLSLASEYRERIFNHLAATQRFIDMLSSDAAWSTDRIEIAQQHVAWASEQTDWCINNLSAFERQVFSLVGARDAFVACETAIATAARASELLNRLGADTTGETLAQLSRTGRQMREESLAFQPYVSEIENHVQRIVAAGTLIAALGLGAIFIVVSRQLAQSARTQAAQTRELTQLAAIAERANDSILVTDTEGRVTWVNPEFERLSGYSFADMEGKSPGRILQGEETDPKVTRQIGAALADRRPIKSELLNYRKTGERYWISLSISPLFDDKDEHIGFVAISNDITEARAQQEALETASREIEHQAHHDHLTGLPNRRYFDHILETQVTDKDEPRILIRIDLDYFKHVNDTLGHAAGDFVLCEVSEILRAHLREKDVVARVGGDEFVILLEPDASMESAVTITERLRDAFSRPMLFDGKACQIGASFGISSAQDGLLRNSELLKAADSALYLAKDGGRNITKLYTPQIHSAVQHKRQLSFEIERAIERGEFEAYFQPQFEAQSEVLIGVEALVRWNHPTRGVLPPAEFLSVAENLKLLSEIDRQVLLYGLDKVAELNAEGLFIPKIAFNTGLDQIMNPDLVDIIQTKDVGFTRLSLEILESVLIEDQGEQYLERIDELRSYDFGIEVDDFGSGHASVVALQRLNPEIVKIDRQLVAPIVQDATARTLVKGMIDMGKALGIYVIGEGIESAAHAAIMRDLGCDAFQGYFFSKPMPFEDLRAFARHGFDESLGKVTSLAVRQDQSNK